MLIRYLSESEEVVYSNKTLREKKTLLRQNMAQKDPCAEQGSRLKQANCQQ